MGLFKDNDFITFNTTATFGSLDDLIGYVINLKSTDFSKFTEFDLELNFDIVNHDN